MKIKNLDFQGSNHLLNWPKNKALFSAEVNVLTAGQSGRAELRQQVTFSKQLTCFENLTCCLSSARRDCPAVKTFTSAEKIDLFLGQFSKWSYPIDICIFFPILAGYSHIHKEVSASRTLWSSGEFAFSQIFAWLVFLDIQNIKDFDVFLYFAIWRTENVAVHTCLRFWTFRIIVIPMVFHLCCWI